MTRVVFVKEGSLFKGFTLQGHACFNVGGPDILCSAISMASQMTTNGLEEVSKVSTRVDVGDGSLAVIITGPTNDIAQALVQSFYLAIKNLRDQYPEFITLTRIDWSE